MASKLLPLRRLSRRLLRPPSSPSSSFTASRSWFHILEAKKSPHLSSNSHDGPRRWIASRSFCSSPLNLDDDTNIPAAIDYHSVLQEDEFHRLADSTIQDLQEKFEEYGDSVQVDDFDIDYGNEVLTLKLGDRGTYVLNKQTPNRQIWLSSPVRNKRCIQIKWRIHFLFLLLKLIKETFEGRVKDLPGVRYHIVRGTLDAVGVKDL